MRPCQDATSRHLAVDKIFVKPGNRTLNLGGIFPKGSECGRFFPVPIDRVTLSDLKTENSRLYDWNWLYSGSQVFSGPPGRPD